jgi:hypothetical protein
MKMIHKVGVTLMSFDEVVCKLNNQISGLLVGILSGVPRDARKQNALWVLNLNLNFYFRLHHFTLMQKFYKSQTSQP